MQGMLGLFKRMSSQCSTSDVRLVLLYFMALLNDEVDLESMRCGSTMHSMNEKGKGGTVSNIKMHSELN
jgi:hypothetical protein